MGNSNDIDFKALGAHIKRWGVDLGFQAVGITDTELTQAENHLEQWIKKGHHGEMDYMHKHGSKRTHPSELIPGTLRVISVRMDYLPEETDPKLLLEDPSAAFISRYALGRDYHKVMRNRLQKLANKIQSEVGDFSYRAFVDSAPVMEKALAEKAGLGWIGKHSNLLSREAGSWFFIGEIYTDLPLEVDTALSDHCGECTSCIDVCPTQAIIAPYEVDGRRCISYLTIELKSSIPVEFRSLMGNRIYGCDDCQQCCPWNKFATPSEETDFLPRNGLDSATLIELFAWTEQAFLKKTEGSPIRRVGYERWSRNIAVALGNGEASKQAIAALKNRLIQSSAMISEHINWALAQLEKKLL